MDNPAQKSRDEELIWKNVTVLFEDPRLSDSYYQYWIPQDDLDLEELKQNIAAVKGVKSVTYWDDHRSLMKSWMENPPEFVFNQCDDGYMNDEEMESHLCSFMDMLKIPYTGSGCESFVLVKDKSIVRGAAMSVGVPVPFEVFIEEGEDIESRIPLDLEYPVFCKLGNASGSTGILNSNVAHNREQAIEGLTKLRKDYPGRPLLLQEYLVGREISIGMVGNPELGDFELFHPVEVDYSKLDPKYEKVQLEEFKRDGDSEFWQQVKEVKADLSEKTLADIKEWAKRMYIRTKCKDFARMDFRADKKGQFKIMDVNPNCWVGGKFRMMAAWAGYSTWPEILHRIFLTAQKRHKHKRDLAAQKLAEEKQKALLEKVNKLKEEFNHKTTQIS